MIPVFIAVAVLAAIGKEARGGRLSRGETTGRQRGLTGRAGQRTAASASGSVNAPA